jgi:hypothetical protein
MSITLINSVSIDNAWGARTLALYSGDLSQMTSANHVDLQALSQNKAANYEPAMPCWVSAPVPATNPNIQFSRILLFEPPSPAVSSAPVAVPNIFQAISCFQNGAGNTSVALPLVSTGSGGADPSTILRWIFTSATTAASGAFPLNTINVVVYDASLIGPMTTLFAQLASSYTNILTAALPGNYASYAASSWSAVQGMSLPAGMTKRQAFGINIYTSNYYSQINPPLYGGNINDPTYIQMMPLYQAIDAGLFVLPGYVGNTNRGESSMSAARIAQYQPGNVILHYAYTSTSIGSGFGGPYHFSIASLTGRQIAQFSQYPGEQEVLYQRNMQDRCVTASCNPGQTSCTFTTTQVNTNPCSASATAHTSVAAYIM